MSTLRERYEELLGRPDIRALLNTIRYAEGTPGESGYRTMFGGGKFSDLSRHPDKVINSGGYSSAAAGAYQFLPGTWQGAAKALGLKTFTPKEQDVAALHLIQQRGALDPFLKGEKFGTVISKLAPEWASLPTSSGGSYYGQPSKKLGDLYNYYQQQKGTVPSSQPDVAETPEKPAKSFPTVNIYLTDKQQEEESTNPVDRFLNMFMRSGKAQKRSAAFDPMEMAQTLVETPPVKYF